MPDYELSQKADQDLTEIYRYSFKTFGEGQADKYFLDLDRCLKSLAENPHWIWGKFWIEGSKTARKKVKK